MNPTSFSTTVTSLCIASKTDQFAALDAYIDEQASKNPAFKIDLCRYLYNQLQQTESDFFERVCTSLLQNELFNFDRLFDHYTPIYPYRVYAQPSYLGHSHIARMTFTGASLLLSELQKKHSSLSACTCFDFALLGKDQLTKELTTFLQDGSLRQKLMVVREPGHYCLFFLEKIATKGVRLFIIDSLGGLSHFTYPLALQSAIDQASFSRQESSCYLYCLTRQTAVQYGCLHFCFRDALHISRDPETFIQMALQSATRLTPTMVESKDFSLAYYEFDVLPEKMAKLATSLSFIRDYDQKHNGHVEQSLRAKNKIVAHPELQREVNLKLDLLVKKTLLHFINNNLFL